MFSALPAAASDSVGVASGFFSDPWVLVTLAFLLLGTVALYRPLAWACRSTSLQAWLFLVAFSGVLALTVVPGAGWEELHTHVWSTARVRELLGGGDLSQLRYWADGVDGPLNVLLYLPAGFFGALLWRRGRPLVWLGLSVTSLVIECYQAYTGTRVGSLVDVVSNSGGALIGVVLAATGIGFIRTLTYWHSPQSSARASG